MSLTMNEDSSNGYSASRSMGVGAGSGDGYGYSVGDGFGTFVHFESDSNLLELFVHGSVESVELYVALLNSETQEEKDSVLGILELRKEHEQRT